MYIQTQDLDGASNLREHESLRSAHHLLYGKKERGKKKTKGVLLGVPWGVFASLTRLNFKGHVEVPVSEIRKVFKKIF